MVSTMSSQYILVYSFFTVGVTTFFGRICWIEVKQKLITLSLMLFHFVPLRAKAKNVWLFMVFDFYHFKVFQKYITFQLFNAAGFFTNLIRDYISMLT